MKLHELGTSTKYKPALPSPVCFQTVSENLSPMVRDAGNSSIFLEQRVHVARTEHRVQTIIP